MSFKNFYKHKFKIVILLTIFITKLAYSNTPIEQNSTINKPPRIEKLDYKSLNDIRKITRKNENNSTKDKISALSNYLNDRKYDDSLGEKIIQWDKKRDKKKLINLDRFDCLSYVETLLALAQMKNIPDNNKDFLNDLSKELSSIMFAVNDVSYTGRNHFMDTEWLKSNEKLISKNITDNLLYTKEKIANIDKASFLNHQINDFAMKYVKEENRDKFKKQFEKDLSKFITIESNVKYISFKDFIDNEEEIQKLISNKIFLFTMIIDKPDLKELSKSEHNIGHVGFVYNENGKIILDHASSTGSKTVQKVNLTEYSKERENSNIFIGFSLYELK